MAAKRTMLNVHIMHASGDVIITTIRTALPKRGVWGNLLHLPRLLQQRPLPLQSNYRVKLMFGLAGTLACCPWSVVAHGHWARRQGQLSQPIDWTRRPIRSLSTVKVFEIVAPCTSH